jgi:O-antigen/teichoic acid export membrane protein
MVLGRLLGPLEFGLVGVGELSLHLLGVFTYLGIESAVIQRPHLEGRVLHTVWWANLGRAALIALALWLAAPAIAALVQAPQVTPVLRVMALISGLAGFTSLGVTLLRKELQFQKIFRYEALGLSLDLGLAIGVALIWPSVWALVAGSLAGTLCRLWVSYRIHPYRPGWVFDWQATRELVDFGKWLFLSAITFFVISKGTDLLSGLMFGAVALGLYQMASRFALLPSGHFGETILNVMFPAYSLIQEDQPRLAAAFLKVLQVTAFIVFPLAAFTGVAVAVVLPLLLGPKWQGVVTLVPWLALGGALQALLRTGSPLFLAKGRPDCQFAMDLAGTGGILLLIYPFSCLFGLEGLAGAYALGIGLGLPLWWRFVQQQLKVMGPELLISLAPPVAGSLLLAAIIFIPSKISRLTYTHWSDLVWLVLLSLAGFAAYLMFNFAAERYTSSYQPIRATLNLIQTVLQRRTA